MEDSPRRSRIRLDSVNRISDRLLQGWTLLSEGCPDCSVPLLRKAPAPQTWCVNCEASFLDGQRLSFPGGSGGGAAPQQHQEQRQPQGAFAEVSRLATSGGGSGGMDTYDDPTADPRLGPFARRSAAPTPTPAHRGGTPPSSQVPGESRSSASGSRPVPLDSPPTAAGLSLDPAAASQSPSAQPRLPNGLAPGHHLQSFGTLTSDEEDAMPRGMNGMNGSGGGTDAGDREAAAARRAESDRISAALGQKMLQGWAMLDAYCPVCNTPLVRSRDGRLFCVGCDMEAMRQGGRAAITGATAAPPAAAAAPPTPQPAVPSAAGRTPGNASDAATAAARLAMYDSAAASPAAAADAMPDDHPASVPAATPSDAAAAAPDASGLPQRMQTSLGHAATHAARAALEHMPQGGQQLGLSSMEAQQMAAVVQQDALTPEGQRLLAILQQHCGLQQAQPPTVTSMVQPMPTAQPHSQQQRPGQHEGSPKRGADDRSPSSGSLANSDRRKRERTSGSQEADLQDSPNRTSAALAAAAAAAGPSGRMTSPMGMSISAPGQRRPESFGRPVPSAVGLNPTKHGASTPTGPADLSQLGGHDVATAIVTAARNTLLTKMLETEQQLAATPGSDVEAVGRLAVLLGQQADALAALRRSL